MIFPSFPKVNKPIFSMRNTFDVCSFSEILVTKLATSFFAESWLILSLFEICVINNPSFVFKFALKRICLDGGLNMPVILFNVADFGLPTNPPKFGRITQSCKNKSSEI